MLYLVRSVVYMLNNVALEKISSVQVQIELDTVVLSWTPLY